MAEMEMLSTSISDHPRIIFFDGVCNLCTRSVQFILQHDQKGLYSFASLQSPIAAEILGNHHLDPNDLKSFILLEGGKIHTRSSAALRVARQLNGLWSWLYAFIIIPRPLRDMVYGFVAANRYRWFGKKESCWLPRQEWASRFLN